MTNKDFLLDLEATKSAANNIIKEFCDWLVDQEPEGLEYYKWHKEPWEGLQSYCIYKGTVTVIFEEDNYVYEQLSKSEITFPLEWLDMDKDSLKEIVVKEYLEYDSYQKDVDLNDAKYLAKLPGYKLVKDD